MSDERWRYPRPAVLDRVPSVGHVAIEASAGTGKTHTLEHLLVDLVLGGAAEIDQVLIVTFTEPATAELKARVRSKLEDLVRLSEHRASEDEPHWLVGPTEKALLQRQLDKFGRASIHTIHGFCHRILLENAFHLRRLFDEEHTDTGTIFNLAFKTALRTTIATDDDLRSYLLAWLEDHSLQSLAGALSSLSSDDARVEPAFHEPGLRKALNNLAALSPADLKGTTKSFEANIHRLVDHEDTDILMRVVGDLARALPQFRDTGDLAALLSATDESLLSALKGTWRTENLFRTFAEVEVPATSAQFSLKHALVRLIPLRAAVVHKFLPVVRQALVEAKQRGFFDYDDMLRGVWERIEDPDAPEGRILIESLRARYRCALIDEFQDTDAIQWSIFRRVFFESADAANRLFVIGDPKQAIYGFRGADVHTYLDAHKAILDHREEEEPVRLAENFRSTASLIDAYNTVFDQRASSPFFDGPIRYDAPVTCGNRSLGCEDASGGPIPALGLVQIVPSGDTLDTYSLKRTLGKWIAREIRRILDEGVNLTVDGEVSSTVGPKDIYVLTRSGAEARSIGQYLREVGVPYAFYKEEGLFQTAEARHVLDLLRAIQDPYRRANRYRAWTTPFFDVPFEHLAACADLAETDPLVATLTDWHELATRAQFEQLFSDILDRSGIVRREIFSAAGERELTNYLHLFEILLEEVHRERAGLADLIVSLRSWIDTAKQRGSDDRNIQRLETEREAVQLMTIHKSKGLEAAVVFVYGGFSRGPQNDRFRVCRQNGERVVYMGLPQSSDAMRAVARATREEDQRLLYVAATRAKALLYLPFVAAVRGTLQYPYLHGTYKVMNDRLLQIAGDVDESSLLFRKLEAREDDFRVHEGGLEMPSAATYSDWPGPPPAQESELVARLEELRSRPLVVSSYSRMKRTSEYLDAAGRDDLLLEIDARAAAWAEKDELPSGAETGIFLHDILERIDFETVREAETYERWIARDDVAWLIEDSMTTHGIEERFTETSRRLVWSTLSTPLRIPRCSPLERLADVARDLREVEFLFPIPESFHPPIDQPPTPGITFDTRRGYIKGFIDLVFEHDGKIFFADWKSDTLERYDEPELEQHVRAHYETQAWLYSIAILKMFGIADEASFDERFGGYMYAFLRGIDGTPGRGFYLHRPALHDIADYERKLVTTEFR